eukprot:scaffold37801_cov69-Phaeocystis_antarctica.AAC.4
MMGPPYCNVEVVGGGGQCGARDARLARPRWRVVVWWTLHPRRRDVRATRTSLLRAVRARGAGQLGPGGALPWQYGGTTVALPWHYRGTTVRTAYRVVHRRHDALLRVRVRARVSLARRASWYPDPHPDPNPDP